MEARITKMNACTEGIKRLKDEVERGSPQCDFDYITNKLTTIVTDNLPDSPFREQYFEFKESLLNVNGRVRNSIQANTFFRTDDFLAELGFKFLHSLPTVLTSLGMLGTFLGIALALPNIVGDGNQDGVGEAIAASGVARDALFVTSKIPGGLAYHAAGGALTTALDQLFPGDDGAYVDLMLVHFPATWAGGGVRAGGSRT